MSDCDEKKKKEEEEEQQLFTCPGQWSAVDSRHLRTLAEKWL